MVGGGILTTSGYVALEVGSHELMIGLWIVGGMLAACGALTMAELSASLPRSGGEFVILSEAYGPLIGFLGGWVSLVLGFVAPIAATASAAASYLLAPWPQLGSTAVRGVGSACILLYATAHATGRSRTAWIQGLTTIATLVALAIFLVLGIAAGWTNRGVLLDRPPLARMPGSALFSSLILVSYCYTGWNGASYLVGDLETPQRQLPLAVMIGTGAVIVIYLGLNVVYALALPVGDLRSIVAASNGDPDAVERIADLAAQRLFGRESAAAISIGLGLVILASLSALMATGPRVAFAMSRAGRLPEFFGKVSTVGEAPARAILSVGIASVAILWSGRFEQILFASGVGLSLTSLLTISAVFVLRKNRPDLPRPFRVPGYPIVPAVFLGFTTLALTFAFIDNNQRPAALAGVAAIAAGLPAYLLLSRTSKPRGVKARVEET